jgi:hypothetical protein
VRDLSNCYIVTAPGLIVSSRNSDIKKKIYPMYPMVHGCGPTNVEKMVWTLGLYRLDESPSQELTKYF